MPFCLGLSGFELDSAEVRRKISTDNVGADLPYLAEPDKTKIPADRHTIIIPTYGILTITGMFHFNLGCTSTNHYPNFDPLSKHQYCPQRYYWFRLASPA